MDRRTVLKNLAVIIGGATLMPSCLTDTGKKAIALKHITIDIDQEKLISDVAETIIPKTETPGAKDLNLQQFVLKMLDDCYRKEDQETYLKGLKEFDDLAKSKFKHAFSECSKQQQEALLNSIDQKNNYSKELNSFYHITKDQTVFGYTYSKYFMTKQIVYELVPGRYNGYYPVNKLRKSGLKYG